MLHLLGDSGRGTASSSMHVRRGAAKCTACTAWGRRMYGKGDMLGEQQ